MRVKFETKEVERTFTRTYVHQVGANRLARGEPSTPSFTPWFTDIGGDLMKGKVAEQWFHVPLDVEWVAAFRLIFQIEGNHYVPALGELRIYPSEDSPPPGPGLWSAEALGVFARVPRGGITARLLRKIKTGPVARRSMDLARIEAAEAALSIPPQNRVTNTEQRKGRGKPDEFYAILARDYVVILSKPVSGARPVATLAKRRGLLAPKVRDMIHEARKRNLLTKLTQGRPGGALTEKAIALLSDPRKGEKSGRQRSKKRK